jgi:hypothetical protein
MYRQSLYCAALSGTASVVQLLVEAGADSAVPNGAGETALSLAVLAGRWECAGALLRLPGGAVSVQVDALDARCPFGHRPDLLAASVMHAGALAVASVPPWCLAHLPLLSAEFSDSPACDSSLTESTQAQDRNGWTCLHHALSLPDPGPDAAAWIATALDLPGVAVLREPEAALCDHASEQAAMLAEAEALDFRLELFRGDAALVKRSVWM